MVHRFIIFVIDDTTSSASPGEASAIDVFNQRLRDGGHWIDAAGIGGTHTATIIDNRDNRQRAEPGSLVMSSDNYSGFWLISADSIDVATQLAMEGSLACNRRVEVRPFL